MIGYELLFHGLPFSGLSLYEQLKLKQSFCVPDLPHTAAPREICMLSTLRRLVLPDPSGRFQSAEQALAELTQRAAHAVPNQKKFRLPAVIWVLLFLLLIATLYLPTRSGVLRDAPVQGGEQALISETPLFPELEVQALPPISPPTPATLSTTPSPPQVQLTTLRIVNGPTGDWERGQILYLIRVNLELYNAGSFDAAEVNVVVNIPGGKEIELTGPKTIVRNKRAKYSVSLREPITMHGTLEATVSCANCR